MKRIVVPFALALALAAGCDPSINRPPPSETTTTPDGAPSELVIQPNGDAPIRAEVAVGQVDDLRTLGLAVDVQNAVIEGFERDDALLLSGGGQLLPLESRVVDGTSFRMVVGTTRAVTSAEDSRVVTLFLRPTGGDVRLTVRTGGDDLGLLNTRGERVAAATTIAAGEEG